MRVKTIVSFFVLLCMLSGVSPASAREGRGAHDRALVRSRQERGWSNHGTEIYLAPDIDGGSEHYSDEELGNVVVGRRSHIRKVYVSPRLHGNLDCNDRLRIGVVEVEKGARVDNIISDTLIDGNVTAPDAMIGGVLIEEGAEINKVDTTTIINGGINAK